MTKQEIIEHIASQGLVESLIKKLVREYSSSLNDLSQEIYLSLLEKDENYIVKLYNNNELNNFIAGMIKNNFYSKTSPFYKNYKKFNLLTRPLTTQESEEKYGTTEDY